MKIAPLTLLAFASAALAGDPRPPVEDLDTALAGLDARYGALKTLQADFVQTTKSDVFGDETQAGILAVEKPGKMRWEFTADHRLFVTDGTTLWAYSPADAQAVKYPSAGGSQGPLGDLIGGLGALKETFTVSVVDDGSTDITLDLVPKVQDQVKDVKMVLSPTYDLLKVKVVDPFDAVTDITFSNVRIDAPVPAGTFTFTPPAGTDVVEAGSY